VVAGKTIVKGRDTSAFLGSKGVTGLHKREGGGVPKKKNTEGRIQTPKIGRQPQVVQRDFRIRKLFAKRKHTCKTKKKKINISEYDRT